MTATICLRQLMPEELKYLRKGKGGKMFSSDTLALIGPADHLYVKCLNIDVKLYRTHLGHGQYIDEATWREATGGKKISAAWSVDSIYGYLFGVATQLKINFFGDPRWGSPQEIFYFDSAYIEAFADAFSHIDRTLSNWYESRPLLSKWFGAMEPEYKSKDAAALREVVRRFLIK